MAGHIIGKIYRIYQKIIEIYQELSRFTEK